MKRSIAILLVLVILIGCGPSFKPTPAASPSAGAGSQVQEAGTDETGRASFADPSTDEEVTVTVVDASGDPLPGMTVVYEHGLASQYEAFFVKNGQDAVVGVAFHLNNADHEIVIEPNLMHRATPDEARAIAGFVDELGKRSRGFYQRTISCDEYEALLDSSDAAVQIELHALFVFFGVRSGPLEKTEWEGGQEPCTGQWDWYQSSSDYLGSTETMVLVGSQPPVMTSADVSINDQGAFQATWSAEDRTEYPERPTYKIDIPDDTVFLGSSRSSDLAFHYRVINGQGVAVVDWTDTRETEVTLGPLAVGSYQLEVYCTDEVINASDIWREQVTVAHIPTEGEPGVPSQCRDESPRTYSWDSYSPENPVVTDTTIDARFELMSPDTFPSDRDPIVVFLLGEPLASLSPSLEAATPIEPGSDQWQVILTFLEKGTYLNYLDPQLAQIPWKVEKLLMGVPFSLGDNRYRATLHVDEPAQDLLVEYARWVFLFQEDTCVWMSSPVSYDR